MYNSPCIQWEMVTMLCFSMRVVFCDQMYFYLIQIIRSLKLRLKATISVRLTKVIKIPTKNGGKGKEMIIAKKCKLEFGVSFKSCWKTQNKLKVDGFFMWNLSSAAKEAKWYVPFVILEPFPNTFSMKIENCYRCIYAWNCNAIASMWVNIVMGKCTVTESIKFKDQKSWHKTNRWIAEMHDVNAKEWKKNIS